MRVLHAEDSSQARAHQAARLLFLALLLLYASTGRYFIDNIDGETMYLTTRAIAQGRLWIVPEMTEKLNVWPGLGGHSYSIHSVFMSFAGLPLYYLGLAVTKLAPGLPEGLVLRAFWLLGPMLYTAMTGAWLLLLLSRMGFGLRRSMAVAMVYGVATMAFPYARYSFSEPMSALLTLGATWFAWRVWEASEDQSAKHKQAAAAWCGAFLGMALLARHANAVVVPLYMLFLLLAGWRQRDRAMWSRLAPVLIAVATFAIGLAAWMWYNYARFGHVLMTGSETQDFVQMQKPNPLRAAAFLIFSPGKGLFFYCPIMIAATVGFVWLYRRLPQFTLLLGSVIAAHTLFYAAWPYYLGDWCWGPRFLVDLLPLWIIPLAAVPLTRRSKPVLTGLVGLSLAVQLLAVGVFYMRYFDRVVEEHGHVNWVYQSPERTPLLGALQTARELRWSRLDLGQVLAGAARPGEGLKTELRTTLDIWPAYAWRFGLPWIAWLVWGLQMAVVVWLLGRLNAITSQPCTENGMVASSTL